MHPKAIQRCSSPKTNLKRYFCPTQRILSSVLTISSSNGSTTYRLTFTLAFSIHSTKIFCISLLLIITLAGIFTKFTTRLLLYKSLTFNFSNSGPKSRKNELSRKKEMEEWKWTRFKRIQTPNKFKRIKMRLLNY